jgi:hypothetical protein
MLCVGLQAEIQKPEIQNAIDSKDVGQVNAAINADTSVLNDLCIEETMPGFRQTVSVLITPLMYAVAQGASEAVVSALLAMGSNPTKQDNVYGDTALHYAVRNNNQTLAELILKNAKGKSLTDIKNFSRFTPLDEAQDDTMKNLLQSYETWGAKFRGKLHRLGEKLSHDFELDV